MERPVQIWRVCIPEGHTAKSVPEDVMDYPKRIKLYQQIEQDRDTKVLSFITGDRKGMETVIA